MANEMSKVDEISKATERYNLLEERIIKAQEKLQKKDPEPFLLRLVEVSNMDISWTPEFGDRYIGIKVYDALETYAEELEKALK